MAAVSQNRLLTRQLRLGDAVRFHGQLEQDALWQLAAACHVGVGALGCRGFAHITRLSDAILIPSIFLLCVVGSYAIHNNVVEVVIMLIFGVIGYLARKFDLNAAAIVLGLILGPIGERGLRRSLLISDGDPSILFSTPLCWVLIALCVVGVLSPLLMERMERRMREGMEN